MSKIEKPAVELRATAQVRNNPTDKWRSVYQFRNEEAANGYLCQLPYLFKQVKMLPYNPEREITTKRGVRRTVGIRQSSI